MHSSPARLSPITVESLGLSALARQLDRVAALLTVRASTCSMTGNAALTAGCCDHGATWQLTTAIRAELLRALYGDDAPSIATALHAPPVIHNRRVRQGYPQF